MDILHIQISGNLFEIALIHTGHGVLHGIGIPERIADAHRRAFFGSVSQHSSAVCQLRQRLERCQLGAIRDLPVAHKKDNGHPSLFGPGAFEHFLHVLIGRIEGTAFGIVPVRREDQVQGVLDRFCILGIGGHDHGGIVETHQAVTGTRQFFHDHTAVTADLVDPGAPVPAVFGPHADGPVHDEKDIYVFRL